MTTRDFAAAVERALVGCAWASQGDGAPADPLELSPRLRLPATPWSELVAEFLPQGSAALLAEVRRIEAARPGPTGTELSGVTEQVRRAIVQQRGARVLRLAASTARASGRYHGSTDVDGVPDCTVELDLEPTTDGVWMGVLTRHGEAPDLQIVLAPQSGPTHNLTLPADQESLVFYVEQDPGADPRLWAAGA